MKILPIAALFFLASCASHETRLPEGPYDLEMRSIGQEQIVRPREDLDRESTFYSFQRGVVVFEVSAAELARLLEQFHAANPGIADDAALAGRLRSAIASSIRVLREDELPGELSNRAEFMLEGIFLSGKFRIVRGAETGSSLVVGHYSYSFPDRGMTVAGGGIILFWSEHRTPIFSVGYWMP
jgi:hypothetical protein